MTETQQLDPALEVDAVPELENVPSAQLTETAEYSSLYSSEHGDAEYELLECPLQPEAKTVAGKQKQASVQRHANLVLSQRAVGIAAPVQSHSQLPDGRMLVQRDVAQAPVFKDLKQLELALVEKNITLQSPPRIKTVPGGYVLLSLGNYQAPVASGQEPKLIDLLYAGAGLPRSGFSRLTAKVWRGVAENITKKLNPEPTPVAENHTLKEAMKAPSFPEERTAESVRFYVPNGAGDNGVFVLGEDENGQYLTHESGDADVKDDDAPVTAGTKMYLASLRYGVRVNTMTLRVHAGRLQNTPYSIYAHTREVVDIWLPQSTLEKEPDPGVSFLQDMDSRISKVVPAELNEEQKILKQRILDALYARYKYYDTEATNLQGEYIPMEDAERDQLTLKIRTLLTLPQIDTTLADTEAATMKNYTVPTELKAYWYSPDESEGTGWRRNLEKTSLEDICWGIIKTEDKHPERTEKVYRGVQREAQFAGQKASVLRYGGTGLTTDRLKGFYRVALRDHVEEAKKHGYTIPESILHRLAKLEERTDLEDRSVQEIFSSIHNQSANSMAKQDYSAAARDLKEDHFMTTMLEIAMRLHKNSYGGTQNSSFLVSATHNVRGAVPFSGNDGAIVCYKPPEEEICDADAMATIYPEGTIQGPALGDNEEVMIAGGIPTSDMYGMILATGTSDKDRVAYYAQKLDERRE